MTTSSPLREALLTSAGAARDASLRLARTRTDERNQALLEMARRLRAASSAIIEVNRGDVERARAGQATSAIVDRLTLDPARVDGMAGALEEVAALPDPLGEGETWTRPNGLQITKLRVPLGVIAIIYEGRPNVTVEAASLAFKAGNAVLLRGSSSALASNRKLAALMREALESVGLPAASITLIEDMDRDVIDELCRMNGMIDVVIPRGGDALIQRVVRNATVPVIETGVGNCHVYVDQAADLDKAERIVINAKTHRPGVCNAAESLLVHRAVAPSFLPRIGEALGARGVEMRACPHALEFLPEAVAASEEDHRREFLDLVISVKVVDSVDHAIDHINACGTKHSEAIVTENYSDARRFLAGVDAAAVYVNASTRFTDGGEFGFGGEMGISTQKLHARGPMGLRELTTSKYVILGDGQVR
jgi:glutamate-5-semialdehyde dehydrogenase